MLNFMNVFSSQLDVDGQFESLIMLLSPRQVHLLVDMFGVFSSSGDIFTHETLIQVHHKPL